MPAINDAQPIEIKEIRWGDFQLAMLKNSAYRRISGSTQDQISRDRFEMYVTAEHENWPMAAQLWQLMIGGLTPLTQPRPEEIEQWNSIAEQTNMPISFDESGLLVPEDTQ